MYFLRSCLVAGIALLPVRSFSQQGKAPALPVQFGNPIDTPFVLSGTFGELRPDHFHTGLDFSTREQEGKPVYAAADGYVSRIKVSADGFGKALYITHPGGYVSVYAHLKQYAPAVAAYIRKVQYEKESFETELFPVAGQLTVCKGDTIALSGNSGSSSGPHLHFEIRDEKTEEPLNPLLFGYSVWDTVKPEIKSLRIIPAEGEGAIDGRDAAVIYNTSSGSSGSWSPPASISGRAAFEVRMTDRHNGSASVLGVYSVQLTINGATVYSYRFDRLNFSDLRYVNAHCDYALKYDGTGTYERLFRLPGNKLKIYNEAKNEGWFEFENNKQYDIKITVKDYSGNTSMLQFAVKGDTLLPPMRRVRDRSKEAKREQGMSYQTDSIEVYVPAGALYEDAVIDINTLPAKSGTYSNTYRIGDGRIPLHTPVDVAIKPTGLPASLRSKALVLSYDVQNKNQKPRSEGGRWRKGFLMAKSKRFGEFAIAVDTLAPVIKLKALPSAKTNTPLQITVTDDLSGIKTYKGIVDGKWTLFEYDRKNNLLTADLQEVERDKNHELVLTVKDQTGNERILKKTFFY